MQSSQEPRSLDIYCIAVGGTGMAPLACLLRELGHQVRGSDTPLYPPMSDLLAQAGITPLVGWDPQHLEDPRPDLVVVGNAVPRHNPEVAAVEDLGLPRVSMPEALARFVLADREPLVVAGTHGKTTTSTLAAHVFEACGAAPGWLVGGSPFDLPASFALGRGPTFVVEGDEYNAAWFDRGPKFLHYRPHVLILTSAELDHLDLYPTHESLLAVYRTLLAGMPEDGLVVACGDDPDVRGLLPSAKARVLTYGLDSGVDRRGVVVADGPDGLELALPDGSTARLGLAGRHNARNALAVWTAATERGLDGAAVRRALEVFRGVRRRAEVVGEAAGVLVIDDFAHHPTAIATTLEGLAARYPGRRLVAAFEPRSLSAGRVEFAARYVEALAAARVVVIAPPFHRTRLGDAGFDAAELAAELSRHGHSASAPPSIEAVLDELTNEARPGDLVVTMSSGSFGDLPRRLLATLRARTLEPSPLPLPAPEPTTDHY